MNQRNNYFNSHPLLMEYYDTRWGLPCDDDHELCKMVILESFSCGLSWLIVLKKEKAFDLAFDHFDLEKISNYDENKIEELCRNQDIIRAKGKIKATIKNAKVMLEIKKEFGSFKGYLDTFTNGKILRITEPITTNELSDAIAKDLKKRGITYFGSVTVYSYLQAIGIINSREEADL